MFGLGQGGEAFLEEGGKFLRGLQGGWHLESGTGPAETGQRRVSIGLPVTFHSGNFLGERRRNSRRRDAGGDVGVGENCGGGVGRGDWGGNGRVPFAAAGRARDGLL